MLNIQASTMMKPMSPVICHHQRGEVRFRLRHELVCGFSAFSLVVRRLVETINMEWVVIHMSTPAALAVAPLTQNLKNNPENCAESPQMMGIFDGTHGSSKALWAF
jgi:hypothetical protein